MTRPPLNHKRVAELLEALRQRTPREITTAVMGFGGCFSAEMWRALELLAAERSAKDQRKVSKGRFSGRPLSYETKPTMSPDGPGSRHHRDGDASGAAN